MMGKKNIYYTLLISQSKAVLSKVDLKKPSNPNILESTKFSFGTLEELENKLKESIKAFETKDQPSEIILFVTHKYINSQEGSLKNEYKEFFSKIFKDLSLSPLGYIETYEAIATHISKEQEFPLNAVVFEKEKTSLSGSLIKGGKVEKTKIVSCSENLQDDLLELITLVNTPPLPAKIIFLSFEEIEHIKEELKKFKWPKDVFLHHPDIKFLTLEQVNESLIKVFAEEINKETTKEIKKERVSQSLPLGFKETEEEIEEEKPLPVNFSLTLPSFSFPSIKLPQIKMPNLYRNTLFVFGSIVVLFLLIFLHENYFHKAVVKLVPYSKKIKIEVNAIYSKDLPFIDLQSQQIKVETTVNTSGEKQVGKKASGSVKLYNFSTKELALKKGDTISYKDKIYLLTESITVPAAKEETVGDSILKKPGTAVAKVEAKDIGKKYNLSTDAKLTIKNLDTDLYFAKLEGKIAGGTSEKVKTVSKDDFNSAREKAKELALEKLDLEKLTNNNKNLILVKDLIESKIVKEKFDKEVGEIADTVKLSATVELTVPFINKEKLIDENKDQIYEIAGNDYTYEKEKFTLIPSIETSEKTSKTKLIVKVEGTAFRKVDLVSLKQDLKFKPENSLNKTFLQKYGIKDISIEKNRAFLPILSSRLPFKTQNLELMLEY